MRPLLPFGVPKIPGVRSALRSLSLGLNAYSDGGLHVVPQDPRNPPTLTGICAYLEAAGLAKYKWPERLELIDALPRTQVGKISKVTLRADIGAKLEHETIPRTPTVTA